MTEPNQMIPKINIANVDIRFSLNDV